jgi:hypothetical protein
MLSLSKISNSGGASTYFEIDDYYTKEEAKEIIKDSCSRRIIFPYIKN